VGDEYIERLGFSAAWRPGLTGADPADFAKTAAAALEVLAEDFR
jgi:hypothetical protein